MKPRKSVPVGEDTEYAREYSDEEISGMSASEVREKLKKVKKGGQ